MIIYLLIPLSELHQIYTRTFRYPLQFLFKRNTCHGKSKSGIIHLVFPSSLLQLSIEPNRNRKGTPVDFSSLSSLSQKNPKCCV